MLKEYIDTHKSQGNTELLNEIIVLTLVTNAPVSSFNQKIGISEINMDEDLVLTTYDNIVKPSLAPIFEFFQNKKVSLILNPF
jgi:hypothetical protein